ncbi:MAG: YceI family protein [Proteobacteria bacterium]|nr:YceI family protein [Pseudomonadota bacterium]
MACLARSVRAACAACAAVLLAIVAACGTLPGAGVTKGPGGPLPAQLPAQLQADRYAQAASRGDPVYRVDSGATLVTLTVRRAGSLARLGHDHIIASHSVQGYVAPKSGDADLYVPLAELSVDEPALRAQAGFDTQPTASDIEGTRTNMQDKVLEVQQFPHAFIRVRGASASALAAGTAPAAVTVTLHGTDRTLNVPLVLTMTPDGLTTRGALELKQTDFGITPLSILGGAVQVKNEVEVRFDIRALRLKSGDSVALTP